MAKDKNKKLRRRTASFSFSDETITKYEKYCDEHMLNRSKLMETLILEFFKKDSQSKPTEKPDAQTT